MRKAYGAINARSTASASASMTGEILGVIGPNGSGKTTLFNSDSRPGGVPTSGRVTVRRSRTSPALPPLRLARRGIGRTFQSLQVFGQPLGARQPDRRRPGIRLAYAEPPFVPPAPMHALWPDAPTTMVELFKLGHVARLAAGSLSYGQQKLVDIAMAFMPAPRLVLLDEPCAGVQSGADRGAAGAPPAAQPRAGRQLRRHRA